MGIFEHYVRHRLNERHRQRGYGYYPAWRARPRRRHRRGGTRVHVTGCCLPIPCGTLVLMVATGAELARRSTR